MMNSDDNKKNKLYLIYMYQFVFCVFLIYLVLTRIYAIPGCPFKKFKNLLGQPNKGVHQFKILNTSMVDYFLTLMLAFVISYFTNFPLVLSTMFCFLLGIFLHILFGVETYVLRYFNFKCY